MAEQLTNSQKVLRAFEEQGFDAITARIEPGEPPYRDETGLTPGILQRTIVFLAPVDSNRTVSVEEFSKIREAVSETLAKRREPVPHQTRRADYSIQPFKSADLTGEQVLHEGSGMIPLAVQMQDGDSETGGDIIFIAFPNGRIRTAFLDFDKQMRKADSDLRRGLRNFGGDFIYDEPLRIRISSEMLAGVTYELSQNNSIEGIISRRIAAARHYALEVKRLRERSNNT